MKIILVSSNKWKLRELSQLFLKMTYHCSPFTTSCLIFRIPLKMGDFEENSRRKYCFVQLKQIMCTYDDSGLRVRAFGQPGYFLRDMPISIFFFACVSCINQ